MSRRSVTTLTIQVRLRTPPGSNTAEVLAFVRDAIEAKLELDRSLAPKAATSSLDLNSMIVKLERKETVYL